MLAVADGFNAVRRGEDHVSKGCASPFAPIWIEEMVKRQG